MSLQSIAGNTEYIVIDEFESDVFRQLVEYIHTGQVILQARTLLGTYQIPFILDIPSYKILSFFILLFSTFCSLLSLWHENCSSLLYTYIIFCTTMY